MPEQQDEQHVQQSEVPTSGPSIASVSNELAELKQKVNELLQLIAGSKAKSPSSTHSEESIDIVLTDADDEDDENDSDDDNHLITRQLNKGKKCAHDEETLEDNRPIIRRCLDSKAKEPNCPLPDPFDGYPKNLKKFLNSLDLCFLGAPNKYGREESKIVTAGLLCTHSKVFPWWETWQDRWSKKEEGYRTWEDFKGAIRSRFKDHLENKNAREKFRQTKQTGKLREYISLMQSINIVAGYSRKIEWETIYDGLKPDLKRMWATLNNPPKDLDAKYVKLTELGAVVDDIEAEQKRNSGGGKGGANEDGPEKSKSKKKKKGKKSFKEKQEEKEKEKAEGGKSKKDSVRVPKELWEQRRKAGNCMRCGSGEHRIKDC